MKIPLVDLSLQHREIEAEVRDGFARLMESGEFVLGPAVEDFEREYAAYCGVDHCIGVANGTDALELGLRALEVGPEAEVILPVNTFVASALAVIRAGARPVLVDCAESGSGMDFEGVAERVSARTGFAGFATTAAKSSTNIPSKVSTPALMRCKRSY